MYYCNVLLTICNLVPTLRYKAVISFRVVAGKTVCKGLGPTNWIIKDSESDAMTIVVRFKIWQPNRILIKFWIQSNDLFNLNWAMFYQNWTFFDQNWAIVIKMLIKVNLVQLLNQKLIKLTNFKSILTVFEWTGQIRIGLINQFCHYDSDSNDKFASYFLNKNWFDYDLVQN